MGKNLIRRLFPGNNTPDGFYSLYQYIIDEDASRLFVLKGGPGVGKSTLMKYLGKEINKRGFAVEYHHCSSDPDSLDAVVFPGIGVGMLDGTAPHVVDPKYPGCVDEVVNLGEYWDEGAITSFKKEIVTCTKEISYCFGRAYRYLKAAKGIYENWQDMNIQRLQLGLVNQKAALLQELLVKYQVASLPGHKRHLFATAITPKGMVSHVEDGVLPQAKQIYVMKGEPGTGKSKVLRTLGETAIVKGFDVEFFHCPIDPNRVEHVLIPQLSLALVSSFEPHIYTGKADEEIDMNACVVAPSEQEQESMAKDRAIFNDLVEGAVKFIAQAKNLHDQLEGYYVPHMDFTAMDSLREKLLERILLYAAKSATKI